MEFIIIIKKMFLIIINLNIMKMNMAFIISFLILSSGKIKSPNCILKAIIPDLHNNSLFANSFSNCSIVL